MNEYENFKQPCQIWSTKQTIFDFSPGHNFHIREHNETLRENKTHCFQWGQSISVLLYLPKSTQKCKKKFMYSLDAGWHTVSFDLWHVLLQLKKLSGITRTSALLGYLLGTMRIPPSWGLATACSVRSRPSNAYCIWHVRLSLQERKWGRVDQ